VREPTKSVVVNGEKDGMGDMVLKEREGKEIKNKKNEKMYVLYDVCIVFDFFVHLSFLYKYACKI